VTKYQIAPDRSQVWIEARSSIHPIHGEAKGLEGELELDISDGGVDLSTQPAAQLELDVGRLTSGNAAYDTQMARVVDARKYPKITGVAREFRPAGQGGRYHVRGDLTFHGVTRTVEGDVAISMLDDESLLVEGEQVFDVRDFSLQPPKILMIRVHPDVRVRVRIEARRRE
jgi:polyisoprenoid-binding protein YceI